MPVAQYASKNGGTGGYWLHTNQSDAMTTNTIGVAGAANFYDGDDTRDQNGLPSYLTDVGAFGENSDSYYGTNDQGGNVWEWNGAIVDSRRGLRGGAWNYYELSMRSSGRYADDPANENFSIGFRLASVPEPSALILMILSGSVMLVRRTR